MTIDRGSEVGMELPLPQVEMAGVRWFYDRGQRELRMVDDPHRFVELTESGVEALGELIEACQETIDNWPPEGGTPGLWFTS